MYVYGCAVVVFVVFSYSVAHSCCYAYGILLNQKKKIEEILRMKFRDAILSVERKISKPKTILNQLLCYVPGK